MIREYEKIFGKTISSVVDFSDSSTEKIRLIFTDGTLFDIQGQASGHDVEYEGLHYQFFDNLKEYLDGKTGQEIRHPANVTGFDDTVEFDSVSGLAGVSPRVIFDG